MGNEQPVCHILLVDDESDWLDFGTTVLAAGGYAVDTALSLMDTRALQEEKRFDLILVDSRLFERERPLVREIAEIQTDRRHRLVIMFATELTLDKMRASFRFGAHDSVDKQYDRRGLLSLVGEQIAESSPYLQSPARVLIVEDDEDWGDILSRYLDQVLYQTTVVSSYAAALDELRKGAFDVVVLDLRLVDEDEDNFEGMELLRYLRETDPTIMVIIVSAYGRREHLRSAFKGASLRDYMAKQQFDPKRYREAVQEAVRYRRQRASGEYPDPRPLASELG